MKRKKYRGISLDYLYSMLIFVIISIVFFTFYSITSNYYIMQLFDFKYDNVFEGYVVFPIAYTFIYLIVFLKRRKSVSVEK